MPLIYHLVMPALWEEARRTGTLTVPSLKEEGFIHCCTEEQIPSIIDRFYADKPEVLVLAIDTDKLESQLVYEWSPSMQQTYPHIYGPINTAAVVGLWKP